ncbi:MAG: hypothetical protein RLY14_2348 [Planctomycetota bacterium]|jgi:hypothetical protein
MFSSDSFSVAVPSRRFWRNQSRKGNAMKIVLIILGIVGGLAVLCCGGFGLMTWWGLGQVDKIVGAELRKQLEASPTAAKELGTIESLTWNITKTGQEGQRNGGGNNILVFDVKASNATGEVIAKFQQSGGGAEPVIEWAKLRKSDGTEVDLLSEEGLEIDLGTESPSNGSEPSANGNDANQESAPVSDPSA